MSDQNFRVSTGLDVGIGGTIITTNQNGDVGIGTTNPTSTLYVVGDGYFTEGINVSGVSTFQSDGLFDANVGIGTDVPTDAVDPANTNIINVGVVTANYYYGDGTGLTNTSINVTGVSTSEIRYLTFTSDDAVSAGNTTGFGVSTSNLTFDSENAYLGIGTTNPTEAVHVSSGDILLDDGGEYTTTVQSITATANRVVSFPDATGVVALVAGSDTQVQFNDGDYALGGSSYFTFNKDTGSLSLTGAAVTLRDPVSLLNVKYELPPKA